MAVDDGSRRKIRLGPVGVEIDASKTIEELDAIRLALDDDKELTARQGQKMLDFVRDNIRTGQKAVKASTLERRKYPMSGEPSPRGAVSSTAPLISSGALLDHLEMHSKKNFSSVRRGKNEWYGFLQDLGVGRLDERSFMAMSSSQVESLFAEREAWVDEVLGR